MGENRKVIFEQKESNPLKTGRILEASNGAFVGIRGYMAHTHLPFVELGRVPYKNTTINRQVNAYMP